MAKKGKGKKGKKGKKGAAAPKFNQQEFDRTMAPISAVAPTPLAADVEHPVVRINELVLVRFVNDPDGLVEHLQGLPVSEEHGGGIDSRNEFGWTALMRAARDGYALGHPQPRPPSLPSGHGPVTPIGCAL